MNIYENIKIKLYQEDIYQNLMEFIRMYYFDSDEILKNSLLEYLHEELNVKQVLIPYGSVQAELFSWFFLVVYLRDNHLENINLDLICRLHNVDLLHGLDVYDEYYQQTKLGITIKDFIRTTEKSCGICGWARFYELLNLFLIFLTKNSKYNTYKNIKEINEYKFIMIKTNSAFNFRAGNEEFNKVYRTILNNYPIDSKPNNFIQVEYANKSKKISIANFNINSESIFIKNLLINYLNTYNKKWVIAGKSMRIFIYYFTQSIGSIVPERFEEFKLDIFKKQVDFYAELNKEMQHQEIIHKPNELTSILISFYRHLIETTIKEHGIEIFNPSFRQAIYLKNFFGFYINGYEFLYYNPLEPAPVLDKLCILPSFQVMQNSNIHNNHVMTLDLKKVNERYREDVREFYWHTNGNIRSLIGYYSKLSEFLNMRSSYEEENRNISQLYSAGYKEFQEDFLWDYRNYIELNVNSDAQMKNILKTLRKFLKHHSAKYSVTKRDLDIFTLKNLESFDGGTPITDNDLNLLFKEFEKREGEYKNGRIYTIVFEIFANSNFRIGEILNFKRKCYDQKASTIKFLSKTSKGEFIIRNVQPEIISLLIEAEKLTNEFVKDGEEMSQFIFIKPIETIHVYGNKRIDFSRHFKLMQKGIEDQLENNNYIPYNIRHTYIDTAYKQGVKNGLSLLNLSVITANSYKTARLYYREYSSIDLYVEALSKVSITDVDINGNILYEQPNHNNKAVKKNLGECESSHCTYELGECLLCKHFYTFLNRIPSFENVIQNYNKQIEESKNELEVEELTAEKKLLAKYLSEMLKMNVNKKEGNVNEKCNTN